MKDTFVSWKAAIVSGFKEVYERHEVNMATILEVLVYILIELVAAPLYLVALVVRETSWAIEDRLGKPKVIKELEKEARAL